MLGLAYGLSTSSVMSGSAVISSSDSVTDGDPITRITASASHRLSSTDLLHCPLLHRSSCLRTSGTSTSVHGLASSLVTFTRLAQRKPGLLCRSSLRRTRQTRRLRSPLAWVLFVQKPPCSRCGCLLRQTQLCFSSADLVHWQQGLGHVCDAEVHRLCEPVLPKRESVSLRDPCTYDPLATRENLFLGPPHFGTFGSMPVGMTGAASLRFWGTSGGQRVTPAFIFSTLWSGVGAPRKRKRIVAKENGASSDWIAVVVCVVVLLCCCCFVFF